MTGSKFAFNIRSRAWAAGLIALVAAAVISCFAGDIIRRPLFDLWQRAAPRDLSGSKVHVVLIDSESLAQVGPWPWPRYHIARLVEQIARSGPKAIGFDIIFAEADPASPTRFADYYTEMSAATEAEVRALEDTDAILARVVGKAPVVVGRAAVVEDGSDPAMLIRPYDIGGTLPPNLTSRPLVLKNIDGLESAALGHGLLNAPPDDDGVVRAAPLVSLVGGTAMPAFSVELARLFLGEDQVVRGEDGKAIRIGDRVVPVDDEGRMLLHFGDSSRVPTMSAVNALRDRLEPDAFSGKVVVIGLGAEGTVDVVSTPIDAQTYGPRIQAQMVDAILRGGWLERPRWAAAFEWSVGLLLALLILMLAPVRRRRWLLLPIGLAILIPINSWIDFSVLGLLVDPLRPLMLGGATAAGVAGGMFIEARIERERLREALVLERVAAAAVEGELAAARAIQLDMLPPRAGLAQIDARLDVDALIEPARSIGGDLYDIIRLDADRIAFLVGDVTGKGVPAALFMALSKALTKSVVLRGMPSLAMAASILNEELMRDVSELNVTMLIGIVDLATGEVVLMSAGHEHPLLVGVDGSVAIRRLDGGPPFCIVDFPYPDETMKLAPGETLVLISDGVSEALDHSDGLFGHDRLVAALKGKTSATEMVEAIRVAVRAFEAGRDPTDDLTVMAVRYLG